MNVAEKVIKPQKAKIFRTVFLYTGQGESTLLVIPTGSGIDDYMYVLVDSDRDKEDKEVDLVELFKDLFKNKGSLEVFINTHPHNDHIGGIKEVYEETSFKEVWHSNHKPGKKHDAKYKDLKHVIDKVGKENEYHLFGTNDPNKIKTVNGGDAVKKLGLIDFVVLSPSKFLCEDIDEGDSDERDDRIHERCGVIKFTYGKDAKSILITGDSDKPAWKEHITDYHKSKLPSFVLSASHHGSRTFFKNDGDDKDVYEKHIEAIKPEYLIISAPAQKDSPHGHPHDDAMELYKKHVSEDNILHLGAKPYSVIVDIDEDGKTEVTLDEELIAEYGKSDDEDNNDKGSNSQKAAAIIGSQRERLDSKPMG